MTINTDPSRDVIAAEIMQAGRYGFVPLTTPDDKWAERHGIRFEPRNFLLDRNGRILLEPALKGAEERSAFERELAALIAGAARSG